MTLFGTSGASVPEHTPPTSVHPFEVAVLSSSGVAARSLGSVLECHGYAVRAIDVSRDGRSIARVHGADAVIIVATSPHLPSVEICRRLHGSVAFDPTTPILVVAAPDCTRNERLEVLGAGAWDTSTEPLDGEILLLKLQRFMRMRRAVGRLNAESMVDTTTGLYTWDGLVRRSQEIVALSLRRQKPLAIVALTLADDEASPSADSTHDSDREMVGRIWRETTRATDAVGKVGPSGLLCIAPDADSFGAETMLRRIRAVLSTPASRQRSAERMRMGYCATASPSDRSIDGTELLRRAVRRASEAARGETVGEVL